MIEKSVLAASEAVTAAASLEALVDAAQDTPTPALSPEPPVPTAPVVPAVQPRIKPAPVVRPAPPAPPVAPAPPAPTPPTPPAPVKKVKFVKLGTPADTILFKNGGRFQFPMIERNGGAGFSTNSEFSTTDTDLIANLREVASRVPGYGIKEIK